MEKCLKTTERAVFLDNKLITNHSPRVPALARFPSVATFPPRPGSTAMGAWRGLLVRLLFSCPWAAPFPSSQTLESAGPRPHARWQRLPTPQPTEADVTWACHGCRPFSALPCLLDPGERCQHQDRCPVPEHCLQARTAPREGSSLRRGPAAGAPWEMGSE